MSKKGFLKTNKILGINIFYLISLIPIIGFTYYKNGIIPVKNGYFPFFQSLQYIVIPIIICLLSYIFEIYYYTVIKKEDNFNNVYNSMSPYINVLCYLVTGPIHKLYITIPLIVVIDILFKFINNKITINQVALYKCILFGVLMLLSMTSYRNWYELSLSSITTDPLKLFLGFGVGGIGTITTLCAIIGYIILLFNPYYKKEIPILSVLGYAVIAVIIYFVSPISFNDLLVNTFNSGFVFASVFVASLSNATPIRKTGRVVYALLVGILSAISINAFNVNIGLYGIILVLSILTPLFNKMK